MAVLGIWLIFRSVEFQNGTTRADLPHVSNVLITRQLQKDNRDVNFGEHEIVFILECVH